MTTSAAHHFGDYEVVHLVAVGGMGEVYRARDAAGREVALKVVRRGDAAVRAMFRDEARVGLLLDHPAFARVHASGTADGVDYLAMDYVSGVDLRGLQDRLDCESTAERQALAIAIVAEAAEALDHAHRATDEHGAPLGLVHCDVSLSNIMVTFDGDVKVVDFGIASHTGASADSGSGTIRGKAAYMAPEQCTGDAVDARADVWSLGVVLYELATGRRCFPGERGLACMLAVVRGEYTLPSHLDVDFPPELEDVIGRALTVDPARRYASAAELAAALHDLIREYDRTALGVAIAAAAKQPPRTAQAIADTDEDATAIATMPGLPRHARRAAAAAAA